MLPQFDFSTYSSQFFWLFLCFGLVFLFIHYYFLPKISSLISERQSVIENDLLSAKYNRNNAEDISKSQKEKILHAKQRAKSIIKDEIDHMRKLSDSRIHELSSRLEQELMAKINQFEELERQYMQNIISDIQKVCVAILKKFGYNV